MLVIFYNAYLGTGFDCMDIDECQTGDNECHFNATCINLNGTYDCECDEGYEGKTYQMYYSDLKELIILLMIYYIFNTFWIDL